MQRMPAEYAVLSWANEKQKRRTIPFRHHQDIAQKIEYQSKFDNKKDDMPRKIASSSLSQLLNQSQTSTVHLPIN